MDKVTRREVLKTITVGGIVLAAGSVVAQQLGPMGGPQPASKIPKLTDWKNLLPELQKAIEGMQPDAKGKYSKVPFRGTTYRVSDIKLKTGTYTCVEAEYFSPDNLLGKPSGFNYAVPPEFRYQMDAQQMAKVPADEQEIIRLIFEVRDEINWHLLRFPNCLPPRSELGKGEVVSGMLTRDPTLGYHRKDMEKILKVRDNDAEVSDWKKHIYEILGFPTSTEEYAKVGLGVPYPSICDPFVSALYCYSMIYRGLTKYDTNRMAKDLLDNSRGGRLCLMDWQRQLFEDIMNGKLTHKFGESMTPFLSERIDSFKKFSPEGKKVLKDAKKHYDKALAELKNLDLDKLRPGIMQVAQ